MKPLLILPLLLIISGCNYLPIIRLANFPDRYQYNSKTIRYSDFLESVRKKEVSRVLISPDNGTAHVLDKDGVRYEVNLAPDKDLLKILTEHNVDIVVTPTRTYEGNPLKEFLNYFFK